MNKYYERNKKWKEEHPERVLLHHKKYAEKHKEEIKQRAKKRGKLPKVIEYRRGYRKIERGKAQKRALLLKKEKGGKCNSCGYDEEIRILIFHHLRDKKFGIGEKYMSESLESLRKETEKCILLCPNCHAIEHLSKEQIK